jgi:hypothetical protein
MPAITVGVVRHLRHPLRRHERGRLDHRQSRIGQAVDQFDLDRGRHVLRFVLQPVARTDFDHFDFFRQRHN